VYKGVCSPTDTVQQQRDGQEQGHVLHALRLDHHFLKRKKNTTQTNTMSYYTSCHKSKVPILINMAEPGAEPGNCFFECYMGPTVLNFQILFKI
jgi:hypothetical protein